MTKARTNKRQRIVRETVRGFEVIGRVVFGVAETPLTQNVAERLRNRGLIVEFATGAEEARKVSVGRTDTAVVVPVVPEASLLATAKIVTSLPTAKVILLAPMEDERVAQFAEFIDANIAFETDGPLGLFAAVIG